MQKVKVLETDDEKGVFSHTRKRRTGREQGLLVIR